MHHSSEFLSELRKISLCVGQVVFPQGEVARIQGEWKDGFLEGKGKVEQTAGGWQEAIFR